MNPQISQIDTDGFGEPPSTTMSHLTIDSVGLLRFCRSSCSGDVPIAGNRPRP